MKDKRWFPIAIAPDRLSKKAILSIANGSVYQVVRRDFKRKITWVTKYDDINNPR